MLAIDKYMYHFHCHNAYDEYWEEGNEIDVDEKYNLVKQIFMKSFSTGVYCSNPDSIKSLQEIIDLALSYMGNSRKQLELRELDTKSYLYNMNQLVNILQDSKRVITYASIYNLENALETTRSIYYSNLPSRLNCMFCLEEDDVSVWTKDYEDFDCDLYELSLTGNLFETYREYVPPLGLTTYDSEMLSHAYWNKRYRKLDNVDHREFLFNGRAKVLRKVNKKEFE